jgi:hypothetical protein
MHKTFDPMRHSYLFHRAFEVAQELPMKIPAETSRVPRLKRLSTAALLSVGLAVLTAQQTGQAQTGALPGALPYSTSYLITGNYLVAGVDLTPQQNPAVNGLSTGTINVSGVPADADIVAAFLYYEAVHAANLDPTAGVKFRGATLVSTGIDASSTPDLGGNNLAQCWGSAGGSGSRLTMARADVLHLLPKRFDVNGVWTGKRLVNNADLTSNRDFQGNPYQLHTVSLRELTGNQAIQSAGATLVIIYRNPSEPLRKIVVNDGVFTQLQGVPISQTIGGFYQHNGNSAKLTYIGGSGGNNQTEVVTFNNQPINTGDPFPQTSPSSDRSWANPTFPITSMLGTTTGTAYGETVTTTLSNNNANPNDCKALAAIIFSTNVLDADSDGLPDGLENAPGGLLNPNGEPLPNLNAMGASGSLSHKDLFVEVNAMKADPGTTYGSAAFPIDPPTTISATTTGHNHLPTPAVIKMVGDVYASHGITPHFDVGDVGAYHGLFPDDPLTPSVNESTMADLYLVASGARGGEIIREAACAPSETVDCQFPDYPGTVSWKFGLQEYRDAPVGPNGEELTPAQQDFCSANPTGTIDGIACGRRRFDRNRRSFFHYALYAHARAKPKSPFPCLDSTGKVTEFVNGTCSMPLTDNPEFHVPKSVSGSADLPGGNVMITLGLWEDFVGTPFVQASTTLHELGHNLDLWHGGLPAIWGNKPVIGQGAATYFEPNCKPNYLSSMSYLFQVHGLFKDDGIARLDYSETAHGFDNPLRINENILDDAALGPTTPLYRPAWFVPHPSALATSKQLSAATKFCNSKFNPASPPAPRARAEADTVSQVIDWNGDGFTNSAVTQNVNFDATFFNGLTGGVPIITTALFGFNDWAAIRLDQISAGRGAGRFSTYASNGSTFEGSTFEGSTFEGSTFEGSTFEGSTFEGSTFEGSTFEGSTFEGSTFEGSTFEGSTFEGSTFEGSTFEGDELDAKSARRLGRAAPHGLKACVIGTPNCTSAAPSTPNYHRIEVSWNASTFGHVFGYHVWRVRGNDPPVELTVPTSPTPNTTFVDTEELPDGVQFRYFAIAEFDDETPHQFSGESNRFPINAINNAPTGNADSGADYTTRRNRPLNVAAPGVLANDTDVDSPPAFRARRAVLVTGPLHGMVSCGNQAAPSICADGSFTYDPQSGYDGPDSIIYKSDDGLWGSTTIPLSGFSSNTTVSIVVTPN